MNFVLFFHRNKYYLVIVFCVSFGPWIAEIFGEWHWVYINETLVMKFTKFINSIFSLHLNHFQAHARVNWKCKTEAFIYWLRTPRGYSAEADTRLREFVKRVALLLIKTNNIDLFLCKIALQKLLKMILKHK